MVSVAVLHEALKFGHVMHRHDVVSPYAAITQRFLTETNNQTSSNQSTQTEGNPQQSDTGDRTSTNSTASTRSQAEEQKNIEHKEREGIKAETATLKFEQDLEKNRMALKVSQEMRIEELYIYITEELKKERQTTVGLYHNLPDVSRGRAQTPDFPV